ncbi:hypothetical protein HDU96_009181 [Phlyctochytrium bullatum]|nr:hypothetical protein HDU96_009181 [Phlyctochytrium bullatum]
MPGTSLSSPTSPSASISYEPCLDREDLEPFLTVEYDTEQAFLVPKHPVTTPETFAASQIGNSSRNDAGVMTKRVKTVEDDLTSDVDQMACDGPPSPPLRRYSLLPTELLHLVFEKLDGRRADLLSAALASQQWYSAAEPFLWKNLKVESLRSFMNLLRVLSCKPHLLHHIVCLHLPFLNNLPEISDAISSAVCVRQSRIAGTPALEEPIKDEQELWWAIHNILANASNLAFVSGLERAPLHCFDALCRLERIGCLRMCPQLILAIQRATLMRRRPVVKSPTSPMPLPAFPIFPRAFMLLNRDMHEEPDDDNEIEEVDEMDPGSDVASEDGDAMGLDEVDEPITPPAQFSWYISPRPLRLGSATAVSQWYGGRQSSARVDVAAIQILASAIPRLAVLEISPANWRATACFFEVAQRSWPGLAILTLELASASDVPTTTIQTTQILTSVKTLNLVIASKTAGSSNFEGQEQNGTEGTLNAEAALAWLLPRFPNLETLGLVSPTGLTASVLSLMDRYCPNLKEVAGFLHPTVTTAHLERHLCNLGKLDTLVIDMTASAARTLASIQSDVWWNRLRGLLMHFPASSTAADWPQQTHLETIVSRLLNVERLDLVPGRTNSRNDCFWWSDLLPAVVRSCPKLKELGLLDGYWPQSLLPEFEAFLASAPPSLTSVTFAVEEMLPERREYLLRLKEVGSRRGVRVMDTLDG